MLDSAKQILLHTDRERFQHAVLKSMYNIDMNNKMGRTGTIFPPEQN